MLHAEEAGFHGALPLDELWSVRPALAAAQIGVFRIEVATGLATWDAVTSTILGLAPVEQLTPASIPIHPADRVKVAERLHRNARGEGERDLDLRIVRPTGEIRWVRSTARPPAGAGSKSRFVSGVVTDVTDRKTAELALAESERRLATLIGNLPGIAYRSSVEAPWPMSYISEGVELLTGYSASEILDGQLAWADLIHPDDLAKVDEQVTAAVAAGEMFSISYRIVTRQRDTRWVLERGRAVSSPDASAMSIEGFIGDISEQKRAEEALRESTEHAHSILDSIPHIIWASGPDGRLDYISNQWRVGVPGYAESLLDDGWLGTVHRDDRARADRTWRHSLATGDPYELEVRVRTSSGGFKWVLIRAVPSRDEEGRISRWYGTCTDIHRQVESQRALEASEALNRGIIETSPDCISILDEKGMVLHSNEATLRLYQIDHASLLVGKPWGHRLVGANRAAADKALRRAQAGQIARVTMDGTGADGATCIDVLVSPITSAAGPAKFLVISRDITHQRAAEESAKWSANHDTLTRLANRAVFQARLDKLIAEGRQTSGGFAVLLLDLDDFKRTNDTLGHDAGDALLATFAKRLAGAARSDDLVARLGGDEFAVLLAGVEDEADVERAIESILANLKEPCIHDGTILDLHTSIGGSLFPQHGSTRAELLKHADLALYAAKHGARGRFRIFRQAMRSENQRRSSMLSLARRALDENAVTPFYQPKIDLETGATCGFEALLRWKHPRRGIQLPRTIDAAFQDVNLAAEISDRMIDRVIEDMKRWVGDGIPFGHIAVNAAAAEFRAGDFGERLLDRLERAALPASAMQLEVTETVFLGRGAEYVDRALKLLSAHGVEIALDDFGTGYASLSHLKHFPVNVIKIDQSFVRDIHSDPEDAAIVRAVINLGKSLGIRVVAEGVETQDQHEFLIAAGCNAAQGFLYGKAMPADHVARLVACRH